MNLPGKGMNDQPPDAQRGALPNVEQRPHAASASGVSHPRRPHRSPVLSAAVVILVILLVANLVLAYFNYSVYRSVKEFNTAATLTAMPSLTPTITETVVPSLTPTVTTTPTEIPSPTATQFAESTTTFGTSAGELVIEATCLGSGTRIAVLVAGMHGDENNPRYMLAEMRTAFEANPGLIPTGVQVCVIPNLNPDGAAAGTRFNAHGVDLNRNWDTNDWVADILRGNGTLVGGGGNAPLSEPENIALSEFLLTLQGQTTENVIVLSFHSTVSTFSDVRPGYTVVDDQIQWGSLSSAAAQRYAELVGYTYLYQYTYPITGEALHWMADHAFVSIGIEMPDEGFYDAAILQHHLDAIIDLFNNWPQ